MMDNSPITLAPQAPTQGLVRLYGPSRRFIGIDAILDDGKVQSKRTN